MFSKTQKTRPFHRTVSLTIAVLMLLLVVIGANPYTAEAATAPFAGQLKVVGSNLCNANGEPIQLKGMSSHGLQWYGQFMNYDSIKSQRDNWGATVVRAAMYTNENGYISNPSAQKAKVKEIVQAAIDLNMYVIIDWHILSDGNPNTYKEQAKSFFQEMATTYGNYPNVIYEICNEPNGNVNWSNDIKPYAEYIIPAIRAIDSDNTIIVGTGTWSQDINSAADSPLSYSNIMYTCHFYSGTHGQWLRDRIDYAMSKGIAIFVTEWGTSDASGNGGPYLDESQKWVDYMAAKKISWTNWSLCDKTEASAALKPGASTTGAWTDSNLSTSGLFVKKSMLANTNNTVVSQLQAPTFNLQSGTYNSAQTVTLNSSVNGAVIYYTVDGTNPTVSSPKYTGPIAVAKTTTIKAFATKSGMTNSSVAMNTYTIAAAPTTTNPPTTPISQAPVTVTYTVANDWGNGGTINVTIKNNGTTPINGWKLAWTLPTNQSITNMWTGSYTMTGSTINVKDMGYNGTIAANGGTATFGFNLNYSGSNVKPTNFTLNGAQCQVK